MYKPELFYSRAILLLITFFHWVCFGLVYPIFSCMLFDQDCTMLPLGSSQALRGVALGVLLAAAPVAQFLSAPLLGLFSDRKGRKKVLFGTICIEAVGYFCAVAAVFLGNLLFLVVSRIIIGVSSGSMAILGASLADISAHDEKKKLRNFALYNVINGVALTLGALLGGHIASVSILNSYAYPFFVATTVTLLNVLLVGYVYTDTFVPTRVDRKVTMWSGVIQLKKYFFQDNLRYLLMSSFLFCLGWSVYWEFVPALMVSSFGFNPVQTSNLYAFGALCYAVSCAFFIRPLINRIAVGSMFFIGLTLCCFSMLAFIVHVSAHAVWFFVPIQQYLLAFIFPAMSTLVSNVSHDKEQGEGLGALDAVRCAAFAIGPLIAGVCLGACHYIPVLLGSFLLALAAGIFIVASKKMRNVGA